MRALRSLETVGVRGDWPVTDTIPGKVSGGTGLALGCCRIYDSKRRSVHLIEVVTDRLFPTYRGRRLVGDNDSPPLAGGHYLPVR